MEDNETKTQEKTDESVPATDKTGGSAEKAAGTESKAEEAAEKAAEVKEEVKQEPKKEIKVSGKLADIIKDIEGLSVLELSDLVKALEAKFGVTAAAPVAVAGAGPSGSEAAPDAGPEEGQTTFNVILAQTGANKISAIKAVRELVPTLGLKEAKDLVDGAPKQVLEGVGKDAANEAKAKLEAAGAKVELK